VNAATDILHRRGS